MKIVIDAREFEPPEPFEKTMDALSRLKKGDQILLILTREPYPLYQVLQRNGYIHKTETFPDGRVEILISESE